MTMKNQARRIGFLPKCPMSAYKRLATGHAQHHGTQDDEGGERLGPHEAQRVVRAERPQNFGVVHDVRHTQHRNARQTRPA